MPVEDDSSSEDRDSSHIRGPRVFDDSDDEPEGIQGDDEEIDSDEAFGEDDEYDMGGRNDDDCLLYTSPSPRDKRQSRMPSSA